MKNIKLNHKIISALMTLLISINAWSMQKSEQKAINKKDIVDEIDRSAIEENESTQVPKIDNMMPAFEMPDFKANVEDSKKPKNISQVKKNKNNKVVKKQKVIVKKVKVVKEKPSVVAAPKPKKQTTQVNTPKKGKKKAVVYINKPLKPRHIFTNDIFIIENGKIVVERNGKYLYKYRFKSELPLDSKGLKLLKENHYLVTDKLQLIADINQVVKSHKNGTDKSLTQNDNSDGLSENIKDKRMALAKKHNRGKPITISVPQSKLKLGDIIYVFGEVQMVTRKKSGHHSAKKFWLYPTIDVKSPLLLKTGNGKYKVVKKPQ